MLLYIATTYPSPTAPAAAPAAPIAAPLIEPPKETPALGCLHPEYEGGRAYFSQPHEYMKWWVHRHVQWCTGFC